MRTIVPPPTDDAVRPEVSVVIPTCNRPTLLARTLDHVLAQDTSRSYEVVVVNDGGPIPAMHQLEGSRVALVGAGVPHGPAHARNRGVQEARADVILFTDDDALPDPGWIEAATRALEASPEAVGVEGPIDGCGFDPLYEHSIHSESGGAYYTCNVAYRRSDFTAVGGFDAGFRDPHCEDLDLARRLAVRGPILFAPAMRVVHPPRPIGFWDLARRARLIESEWLLFSKHPDAKPPRWSVRWGPWIRIARNWQRKLTAEKVVRGNVRRAVRLFALASAQLAIGLYISLTRWPRGGSPTPGSNRP